MMTTLNNRLTLATQSKITVNTISNSELLGRTHHCYELAIANEDTCLACAYEYCAVFALVDVYACCCVEEEDIALFAV